MAKSAWRHAEHAGALKLLDDPLAAAATQEIVPGGRSRWEIQRAIKVGAQGQRPRGATSLMLPPLRHERVHPTAHAPVADWDSRAQGAECLQGGRRLSHWLLILQPCCG